MLRIFFVSLAVTTISVACTNRAGFDTLKSNKLNDCYSEPLAKQDQCIQDVEQMDYESYKRQREELLKGEEDKN